MSRKPQIPIDMPLFRKKSDKKDVKDKRKEIKYEPVSTFTPGDPSFPDIGYLIILIMINRND